eukprot:3084302-Amphidinium_carterae.1
MLTTSCNKDWFGKNLLARNLWYDCHDKFWFLSTCATRGMLEVQEDGMMTISPQSQSHSQRITSVYKTMKTIKSSSDTQCCIGASIVSTMGPHSQDLT